MTDELAVLDRLLARCTENPVTGCWEWTGSRNNKGYGQIGVGRWSRLTHRVTYEFLRAEIPAGLELDHLCRVPLCVNPWHLDPVTHAVNMRRGVQATKTHCPQGHPYRGENLYVAPSGGRRCRTCALERDRASLGYQGNPMPADRTHCPQGHEYAGENLYVAPSGGRGCRACRRTSYGYQGNPTPTDRTHCPQGHEYAGENLRVTPKGERNCRACGRAKSRANRARKKAQLTTIQEESWPRNSLSTGASTPTETRSARDLTSCTRCSPATRW